MSVFDQVEKNLIERGYTVKIFATGAEAAAYLDKEIDNRFTVQMKLQTKRTVSTRMLRTHVDEKFFRIRVVIFFVKTWQVQKFVHLKPPSKSCAGA